MSVNLAEVRRCLEAMEPFQRRNSSMMAVLGAVDRVTSATSSNYRSAYIQRRRQELIMYTVLSHDQIIAWAESNGTRMLVRAPYGIADSSTLASHRKLVRNHLVVDMSPVTSRQERAHQMEQERQQREREQRERANRLYQERQREREERFADVRREEYAAGRCTCDDCLELALIQRRRQEAGIQMNAAAASVSASLTEVLASFDSWDVQRAYEFPRMTWPENPEPAIWSPVGDD